MIVPVLDFAALPQNPAPYVVLVPGIKPRDDLRKNLGNFFT
jgi:hypothetical protein